jgi:hypothetical protein
MLLFKAINILSSTKKLKKNVRKYKSREVIEGGGQGRLDFEVERRQ